MANYNGMDRFQTGKSLTHRKAEIQTTVASVVRVFKSNGVVNEADLDYIIGQAQELKKEVEFWNVERLRELGKPVKTP